MDEAALLRRVEQQRVAMLYGNTLAVSGSAIWAGWWGSSHGDLPGILDTIKADAARWLLDEQCAQLRVLLLQPRPPLTLPLVGAARRDAERRGHGAEFDAAAERAS